LIRHKKPHPDDPGGATLPLPCRRGGAAVSLLSPLSQGAANNKKTHRSTRPCGRLCLLIASCAAGTSACRSTGFNPEHTPCQPAVHYL